MSIRRYRFALLLVVSFSSAAATEAAVPTRGGGMMQQQLLQKFDTNGNGQLDPSERQAAQQYMQIHSRGRRGRGGRGSGGSISPQMHQKMLQKFDANGNGQLDPSERQAAMQFLQQHRAGGAGAGAAGS